MEPITAGAIALATLLLNKSVEKTGKILTEKASEQGNKVMNLLKRKSPETANELEATAENPALPPGEPQYMGEAVLVEKIESAAKADPEIKAAVEALGNDVQEAVKVNPQLEKAIKELTEALKAQQKSSRGITNIGDKEEPVAWCWQCCQPPEGQVLVMLDDVTDLRSCRKVLPRTNRFRVLMTTRLRSIDSNCVEIFLDVLSPLEACKLLTALLGEKDRRVQQERETAERLCAWLGYLPLGLELVGRYLAEDPHLSLTEMLERLKAQRLKDEAIDPSHEQLQNTEMTAKRSLRAAFELSWQELEPVTQHVAQLLSLFAPTVFVWEWVAFATELFNCAQSDINTATKQLYKRHLIQQVEEQEGGYKIHPLIREFLQAKLAASKHQNKFRQALATDAVEIAKEIPYSPTREFMEMAKDLIPHLEEVGQNLTDTLKDEDLVWPFVGLGRFYESQGLYTLAEPWYQQCLELSQRLLGEEHPRVASSLNNLAGLYHSQERYARAEALYVQALALRKHVLGEEHPDVASSLNNLAEFYDSQGRYDQAEPLYVQALALYKQLLGEEHPRVASSLNNLAEFYDSQGYYDQAEPLYLQALALYKCLLGEGNPLLATSLNNLAEFYDSQGHYDQAEPLYVQALALRKRLLGEEHPDVASSLSNLAGLYHSQGRYSQAEVLFVQAVAVSEEALGVNHPDTVLYRENLAIFRQERSTGN